MPAEAATPVIPTPEKYSNEWYAQLNRTPYTREDLSTDCDNSCDHGSSAINTSRIHALIDTEEKLRTALLAAVAVVGRFDPDDVPDSWRVALDPKWVRIDEDAEENTDAR